MTVKFEDGKVILVNMPKKKTFEKMFQLNDDDISEEMALDALTDVIAEILSNNKNREIINKDFVSENYTFEDMQLFLQDYMDFTNTLQKDPN